MRAPLMVRTCVLLAGLSLLVSFTSARATDPVSSFIAESDSIARNDGDAELARYVEDNAILVGAVVGQLLHVAMVVGDDGQKSDEQENVAFAGKLATLHRDRNGSDVPLELVDIYKSWNKEQRATRRRAMELEAQAGEAKKARDFETAIDLLRQANELYTSIDDRRSVAVNWGTQGVVQWGAGNAEELLQAYANALEARRAIEDRILEGRTLNGLGSANYLFVGDLDRAGKYYDEAIALRRRTGDYGALGTSLTYRGNVYRDSGRPIEAREAYEQALEVFESWGEPWQRSQALDSIGTLYYQMNRLQASNDAYLAAIKIAVQYGEPLDAIVYRLNLVSNLGEENRYSEAQSQLAHVEELLKANPDPEQELRFYQIRGLLYTSMDELERARDDLVKMRELAQQYEAPKYQLESLLSLGWLFLRMSAHGRAVEFAGNAKELAYELGNGRLAREADMLAAIALRNLGNYDKSLEHWNWALEQDDYDGMTAFSIQDKMGMANVYASSGQLQEALRRFREVRPEVQAGGDKELVQALDLGTGHAFEPTNPDSAAYYYERALASMEQDREAAGGFGVNSGFLSGLRRQKYEEIARYYASVYRDGGDDAWSAKAFQTIERAKARGLLDLLQGSIATRETDEERRLLDELYALDESAADYRERKRALEDRYAQARDARLDKSVGSLQDAAVASLHDVQDVIDRKSLVLSFALGDSTSFLWAIDRKGAELYELPPRSELRGGVQRLRDALARPGAGDDALKSSARKLYMQLLDPAGTKIEQAKNIVIVPDGFLFEIPFEILLTRDAADDAAWPAMPFLARSHTTVYAPSASVFVNLQSREKRKYDLDLVAVGDPRFETLGGDGAQLNQLPYTREEIVAISERVKDDKKVVLLGGDASEARVRETLEESTPRLLHLATHGLVDPADPIASSVALCREDGSQEDGYLHMLEILSMHMDVGLVVLSACESARGQVNRGEGVVGLGRAFIASGAKGIVASLWAVSDESTSALMTEFYARMLGKKKSAGEAMSYARRALLEQPDYAHPFYWSPFVVIGSENAPW